MTKKTTRGFTIIELLVVVAIIGTLSGVVLTSLQAARQKAYNATRVDSVSQLASAINLYLTNNLNVYPSTGGAWKCIGLAQSSTCWTGNYTGLDSLNTALLTVMSGFPKDPAPGATYSDYYVYNSLWNPGVLPIGTPPTVYPKGAYLSWVVNDLGQTSPCGRGTKFGVLNVTQIQCMLYLGPGNN